MRRTLFIVMVFLVAVNPAFAGAGKKLTNKELKQLTSHTFFIAGYETPTAASFHVTFVPNGTREVYWNNGAMHDFVEGKWRLKGDTICINQPDFVKERCEEWRRNGDRFEYRHAGARLGYFYILPRR